jgi:hypothetical protein
MKHRQFESENVEVGEREAAIISSISERIRNGGRVVINIEFTSDEAAQNKRKEAGLEEESPVEGAMALGLNVEIEGQREQLGMLLKTVYDTDESVFEIIHTITEAYKTAFKSSKNQLNQLREVIDEMTDTYRDDNQLKQLRDVISGMVDSYRDTDGDDDDDDDSEIGNLLRGK